MKELYKDKNISIPNRVKDLLSRMTIEEKMGQLGQVCMSGYQENKEYFLNGVREGRWGSRILGDTEWAGNNVEMAIDISELNEIQRVAVEESRLGIPIIYARDVIYGQSTVLPIPLAQASSWNPKLIEEAYTCIAREAASMGIHWTFSPMMDITRDPRWGRIIETSGEDPYLTSQCTEGVIRGFQGDDPSATDRLLACAKHFCGYGFSEGGRDYDVADISENTLHNMVLPPFINAVKAGVTTVMSSFNDLGGTPVSGSKEMIQGWLKDGLQFDGLVVSDWSSIDDLYRFGLTDDFQGAAERGFNAGVDMGMTSDIYDENIPTLFKEGKVSEERIDDAVGRILTAKFRAGLFDNPYTDTEICKNTLFTPEHRKKARELAEESIVLLKNREKILPLKQNNLKIAVVGPYSDAKRQHLGSWCVDGNSEDVISIIDGIRTFTDVDVITAPPQFSDEMIDVARSADVVILCIGESQVRNGEASNISELKLPPGQEEIISAIGNTGTPMIVTQSTGRPIPSDAIERYAKALLYTWHGGTEIGAAVANIIFGKISPSGKLPVTIPRNTGQIPIYYNHKPSGKALGIPHYKPYKDEEHTPLYPFGYGLSYTNFSYSDIKLSKNQITTDETVTISVTVTNTGDYFGMEIAQCYIRDLVSTVTRPVKELKGFKKIALNPQESTIVEFTLGYNELSYYGRNSCYELEPGQFIAYIGTDSTTELSINFEVK